MRSDPCRRWGTALGAGHQECGDTRRAVVTLLGWLMLCAQGTGSILPAQWWG